MNLIQFNNDIAQGYAEYPDICNFADYSYKEIVDAWSNSKYSFGFATNGVSVENFYEDSPWQLNRDHNWNWYWFDETLIKKIAFDAEEVYTLGACPFVYSQRIYQDNNASPLYQVVFLPKSDSMLVQDFVIDTDIDELKLNELKNTLDNLGLTNPIYITTAECYGIYSNVFPENQLYCLGDQRSDKKWNDRLLDVILHATELYFHTLSTPCVFSSYMGKDVKFYSTDILTTDVHSSNSYSMSLSTKSPEYLQFKEYIENVFENKLSDMDYWIRQFLSLDRIQSPEDLRQTLSVFDEASVPEGYTLPQTISMHTELTAFVSQFNREPSQQALDYFEAL